MRYHEPWGRKEILSDNTNGLIQLIKPNHKLALLGLFLVLGLFISFSGSVAAQALDTEDSERGTSQRADYGRATAGGDVTTTLNAVSSSSLGVSIVSVASGQAYEVVDNGLTSGAPVYIDRLYSFTTVPAALEGAAYVKTANNDKRYSQLDFLTLQVDQDVTAYVAYDSRATGLPSWLSNWTNTGETLGTTDVTRNLFSKPFAAGTIAVGGNSAAGAVEAGSNYNVILVGAGESTPTNQVPVADAGPDQSVTLNSPAMANLDGTVADDGLPSGQLNVLWTLLSGPGAVTFGNATDVDTSATFLVEGSYVLRLTVDDGSVATTDDVTITVIAATSGTLEVQILQVASGKTYQVVNQGLLSGVPVFVDRSYTFTSVPVLVEHSSYIMTANNDKSATDDDFLTLSVNKDVAVYVAYDYRATTIPDWLSDWAVQVPRLGSSDVERVLYLKEFPAGNITLGGNLAAGASGARSNYNIAIIDLGTSANPNFAPTVDAGPDTSGTLNSPAVVTLDGTVNDDGLPSGQLKVLWSSVSGPGTVVFGDSTSVVTTATFVDPGPYVLRLTAGDGDLTTTDDLIVTIIQPNLAPQVNAGPDVTIALADAVVLDAIVTDDGLPNPPGAYTAMWSKLSGSGVVTFADAAAINTTATFSELGDYVLRLVADDGDLAASDDVSVTVSSGNQAPVVAAGVDSTLKVSESLTLDGDVTDDGLPNPPGAVATMWTKVSGLGSVTFGSATAVDTTAVFSEPGTYVLRLTADDGGLTGADEVTATVEADDPSTVLEVNNLAVASGSPYQVIYNGLTGGNSVYLDRAYTLTTVPNSVDGYTYIKSANEDKENTSTNFLSFAINMDAKVYVAYDNRVTALPNWLSTWANTNEILGTTDVGLKLYAKDFVAGPVTLGGNLAAGASGAGSNYIVVIGGSGVIGPAPTPGNQSPSVDAGGDVSVTLGDGVALDGMVSDDGLPNPPGMVATQWSQISGPGSVEFANPLAVDTTATLPSEGTYVLRLTADDGDVSVSDDVTVNVIVSNSSDTISINPNVQHQTIVGWEFTDEIGIRDFPNDFHRWRDELIDRAVNELGINRMRLESHREFDKVETTNDNNDPFAINMAGFDFTEFDKKIDHIAVPMKQRLQANGEDLYINFITVGVAANADLLHHDSEEFAEYVLAHFLHMQSKYGFVPDAVELSLEPNVFNTFDQDGTKYGLALVATANRLESNGFATVDFYGPSLSNMSDTIGFFDRMITVPGVLDHLDVIAYHRYSTQSLSLLARIVDRARTYGLGTAQLERIDADYHVLHEDLKIGNNVAWQQYALGYPTNDNGAQYFTIENPTSSNPTVTTASRTKLFRQYFKYVRKGAVRVDANSSDGKFDPVAFINANGKYVVVVKSSGGGNFSVSGLPAGTYGISHTTGSTYGVDHASASIGSGQALTTNIPVGGVITIYGK